jgi:hypothetical protein
MASTLNTPSNSSRQTFKIGQTITHSNLQTLTQLLNKFKVVSSNTMANLEWQTQT